jgi:hypothetical protein
LGLLRQGDPRFNPSAFVAMENYSPGNPMGVLLEAEGFSSYEAARFAGNVALADFLEQLEREKLRNEYEKRSARVFRDRD